jgi:hypothetical protein
MTFLPYVSLFPQIVSPILLVLLLESKVPDPQKPIYSLHVWSLRQITFFNSVASTLKLAMNLALDTEWRSPKQEENWIFVMN